MGNSGWNCLTNNYTIINSCLLNNKSDNNDNNNTPISLNILSKSTLPQILFHLINKYHII